MKHYADDNKKAFTAKKEAKHGGKRFAKESGAAAPKHGRHAAEEPASEAKKAGRRVKAEEPVQAAEAVKPAAPVAAASAEAPAPKQKKRGFFSKSKKEAPSKEPEAVAAAAPEEPAAAEPEAHAAPQKPVLPKLQVKRKEIVRKTSFDEPEEKKTAEEPEDAEDEEVVIEPDMMEEDPGSQPAEAPEGAEMVDIVSSSTMLNADGTPAADKVKKNTVIHVERPKRARTDCPATPTAPEPAMKAGYAPAFIFSGFLAAMALLFIVMPKLGYSALSLIHI